MLNIAEFLSRGETSLYSNKEGLAKKAAVALVAPLVIGMLSACSVAPSFAPMDNHVAPAAISAHAQQSHEFKITGEQGNKIAATVTPKPGIRGEGYSVDGNTLLMQALIDPSMSKIRVASSTSAVLDAYVKSLPSSLKAAMLGRQSATQLAKELHDTAPDGVAISSHNRLHGSACIVFAVGASSTTLPNGKPAEYVDFADSLYVASKDENDATTLIHEGAHCPPYKPLKLDDSPLSPYYESSIRELRSDLAIVLYGASQTGSFEQGLDNVTAFRGAIPVGPNHATVAMLEVVTKGLDAKSFVGMPVKDVITSAVNIVDGLAPATNKDLRLAFAKEAWSNKLAFMGSASDGAPSPLEFLGYKAGQVPAPSTLYTGFAGQSFQVDMNARANTIINRSLNHALTQTDEVRASISLTVERVEKFAKDLGVTLSKEQREKAEFVDGTRTMVGTAVSKNGNVVAKETPFSMVALEESVQGDVKNMVASGLIALPSTVDAAINTALASVGKPGSIRDLSKSFGNALEALQTGLAKQGQQRSEPARVLKGPGY
jgi:hypothetical protein